MASILKSTGAI